MDATKELNAYIAASGDTIPALAARAGKVPSILYRILNGTTDPRLSVWNTIHQAFLPETHWKRPSPPHAPASEAPTREEALS